MSAHRGGVSLHILRVPDILGANVKSTGRSDHNNVIIGLIMFISNHILQSIVMFGNRIYWEYKIHQLRLFF